MRYCSGVQTVKLRRSHLCFKYALSQVFLLINYIQYERYKINTDSVSHIMCDFCFLQEDILLTLCLHNIIFKNTVKSVILQLKITVLYFNILWHCICIYSSDDKATRIFSNIFSKRHSCLKCHMILQKSESMSRFEQEKFLNIVFALVFLVDN